jgi:hypothetical protein
MAPRVLPPPPASTSATLGAYPSLSFVPCHLRIVSFVRRTATDTAALGVLCSLPRPAQPQSSASTSPPPAVAYIYCHVATSFMHLIPNSQFTRALQPSPSGLHRPHTNWSLLRPVKNHFLSDRSHPAAAQVPPACTSNRY